MATNGEIIPVSNVYNLDYSVTSPGTKSITFPVRDHFVDGDIKVNISPATGVKEIAGGGLTAGNGSASVTSDGYFNGSTYDTSDKIAMTTVEATGYYKITATGSGTVNRAAITSQTTTAGYFYADAYPVTESSATSLSSNDGTQSYFIVKSVISQGTVDPDTGEQVITISAGYYPSDREITVGGSSLATLTTSLSNTGLNTYFDAGTSGTYDVSVTPLYSSTSGFVAASTDVNAGGVEYYIIKTTSVTKGTSSISGSSLTRGVASWGTGWISSGSISAASFANTATSGTSYVDISSFAPALVTGSGLYINSGYVDNLYISLSQLVPDTPSADLASNKILSGYSALNRDGQLIAGSIQTWDGSYTIE